jgi:hypothetical protein
VAGGGEAAHMQWQQKFNAAALPVDAMNSWYQGMMTLQQLSHRLSSLDEQKGKYITVSELKSVVFSTIQSFNQRYRLKNNSDACHSIQLEMRFLKPKRLNWSCA